MIHSAISRLEELVNRLPGTLSEKDASYFLSGSIAPGKWNRQEILGHLIDSALNNLQRFVRTQYEHDPFVYYEQDTWNKLNAYTQASHTELIELWKQLNAQILRVLKNIPDEAFTRQCRVSVTQLMPLHELVYDYIGHLEYHLKQIVDF